MTELDTKTLQEGMLFSSPILFDDGKNMFLAERMPIGKMHLDAIRRWSIKKLITYGKQIDSADDGLDDLELLEEDDEGEVGSLFSLYMQTVADIETVFNDYAAGKPINKQLIDSSTKNIITFIKEEKAAAVSVSFIPMKEHLPIAVNAVNIAIVSGILAVEMKFPEKDVQHLIIAAILHDIDMLKQPERIVNKPAHLTEDEFSKIRTHSQKIINPILESLGYPKEVALIVFQHHERWDGKGYPEAKVGAQIYLPARVLAVADSFEAMLSDKPYRTSFDAHDAVKNLLAEKDTKFDPTVLKAFISCIGLYPIGSHVLLSDGSIAKIAEINPSAPFFPTVRIFVSKSPELPTNSLLDLKEQGELTITRALKQSEVSQFE